MQRPIEIQRLMDRKGNNASEIFGNIAYSLMSHLHLGYEEVKKIPVPMALELMKRLQKEAKEMEKRSRRKR